MARITRLIALSLGGLCFLTGFLTGTSAAWAKGDSGEAPTGFFDLGLGLTTYKSKAAQSNDTSLTMGYSFGVFAGDDKSVGISLKNDTSATKFAYPDTTVTSQVTTTFSRTLIDYRWGPLYVGAVLGRSELLINKMGEAYLDALGTGYGAHVKLSVPAGAQNYVFVDVVTTSIGTVKETVQTLAGNATTFGGETDITVGGRIKLTKRLLSLLFAYESRSFSFAVAGTSYAEAQTMTWVGLSMQSDF